MSADDALRNRATVVRLGLQIQEVFDGCVEEALKSIQSGSPITGAPGQPVQSGKLLASFKLERPSRDKAVIGTSSPYAVKIEHGVGKFGPATLRSSRGGFHSVKLTAAGMGRVLAAVMRRVRDGEP